MLYHHFTEKEKVSPVFSAAGRSTRIMVWLMVCGNGLPAVSVTYSILNPPSKGSPMNSPVKELVR